MVLWGWGWIVGGGGLRWWEELTVWPKYVVVWHPTCTTRVALTTITAFAVEAYKIWGLKFAC